MSSSSNPDSDSSGSKEGSSDSKKTKKPRNPEGSSATIPVVSLEAFCWYDCIGSGGPGGVVLQGHAEGESDGSN